MHFDPTAPARHDRLVAEQTNYPDLTLPAPQMPGCERADVYLAQRGWSHISARDLEVRNRVFNPETQSYGWAVYDSPPPTSYYGSYLVGFLRENEQPVLLPDDAMRALHIKVLPFEFNQINKGS